MTPQDIDRRTFHHGEELINIKGRDIFSGRLFGSEFTWEIVEVRNRATLEIDLNCNYRSKSSLSGSLLDIQNYDRRQAIPEAIQLMTIGEKIWKFYEKWNLEPFDLWLRVKSKRTIELQIDEETIGGRTIKLINPWPTMKASELIDHLNRLVAEHGDLEIMTASEGWAFPTEKVTMEEVIRLVPDDPLDKRWTEADPGRHEKKVFLIQ